MSEKYLRFNPGEYYDWEQDEVEYRFALLRGEVEERPEPMYHAMLNLHPMDEVSDYELRRFNALWNPYDPLFNDREYAKKVGYKDIPAFPSFIEAHGRGIPKLPKAMADTFYYAIEGGNIWYHTPVYGGDKLKEETVTRSFVDTTKPNDDIRMFEFRVTARAFNQNGELAVEGETITHEGYRKIIDGSPVPSFSEVMSEWYDYLRPAHYTTEEEWEYIISLWDKEEIRGAEPRYWEDINIGDEPAWICTGPINYMDMISHHGDLSLISREQLRHRHDIPMIRDCYGQYLTETSNHYGGRNIPGARSIFFNGTASNHMLRAITNYIGDQGFVTSVKWRFQQMFREMQTELPGKEFLDKVPYMKGKGCTSHGAEGDTIIGKSYVTDKYINEKGEHIVEFVAWGETLDNEIIQVCEYTARVPSREDM